MTDFSSMLVQGLCDLSCVSALHSAVAGDKSCRKHLLEDVTYDFGCAAKSGDPWFKKVTNKSRLHRARLTWNLRQ